ARVVAMRLAALVAAIAGSYAQYVDTAAEDLLYLNPIPTASIPPQTEISETRRSEIAKWIAELAKIDREDFGLSSGATGVAFEPQADATQLKAILLGSGRPSTASAFKDLVAAGPDALPQLLDHLDDATPTKLGMRREPGYGLGGLLLDEEMPINPAVGERR